MNDDGFGSSPSHGSPLLISVVVAQPRQLCQAGSKTGLTGWLLDRRQLAFLGQKSFDVAAELLRVVLADDD